MAQDSVERFLGRLITDDDFRELAESSFERACMEEGFVFTKEEHRVIRVMDFHKFAEMDEALDSGIKRSRRIKRYAASL